MRLATMRLAPVALILVAIAGGPSRSRGDTLYSQPFDSDGSAYASQNDTSAGGLGSYATVYDNFTLSQSASVTGVSWDGLYFNPASPGTISSFTIDFYQNGTSAPGTLIQSETITGNAGETSLGTIGGFPTYSYTATLPTALAASAGTEYWISIVASTPFPPQWGWADGLVGTGGDGNSYDFFLGTGGTVQPDRAFTLTGTPTAAPEPSSLALGGVGLGLAAVYRYRRRRRAAA